MLVILHQPVLRLRVPLVQLRLRAVPIRILLHHRPVPVPREHVHRGEGTPSPKTPRDIRCDAARWLDIPLRPSRGQRVKLLLRILGWGVVLLIPRVPHVHDSTGVANALQIVAIQWIGLIEH